MSSKRKRYQSADADTSSSSSTATDDKPAEREPQTASPTIESSIDPIEPLIPSISKHKPWLFAPGNIMMESKDSFHKLNRIPYFDDKTVLRDDNLLQEMQQEYFDESLDNETMIFSDEALYKLVIEIDKSQNNSPDSETRHLRKLKIQRYRNSAADIGELDDEAIEELRYTPVTLQEKLVHDCPPDLVFRIICDRNNFNGSSIEILKKRFMNCCRVLALAPDKEKYLNVPNVDAIDVGPPVSYKREQTMASFHQKFCRRCYKYDCLTHRDIPIPTEFIKKRESTSTVAAAAGDIKIPTPGNHASCSIKEHMDTRNTRQSNKASTSEPDAAAAKLSTLDEAVLNALAPIFPGNPCTIAAMMMIDCDKVERFLKRTESPIDGPTKEKPGKSKKDEKLTPVAGGSNSSNQTEEEGKRRKNKPGRAPLQQPKNPVCPVPSSSTEIVPNCYKPCVHPGTQCTRVNNCACKLNGTCCEKFCICDDDCTNKFKGCACRGPCITSVTNPSKNTCPCYLAGRECDPDLCKGCGAHEHDLTKVKCKNVSIQRKTHKHLLMAKSTIPGIGWGAFTKDDISKGDFVYEYTGELISYDEVDRRALIYDNTYHTFAFDLNSEYVLDAMRFGNKIRFANHSDKANCRAKLMMVNGDHRIGVYADRNIKAEEELFLDYKGVLIKHDNIRKKREKIEGKGAAAAASKKHPK